MATSADSRAFASAAGARSSRLAAAAPLVSVVTPFYNTERYLAEAIESVLSQTYGGFEYVLLDNCSTDGSLAIAEAYARRDGRIRLERNSGFMDQDTNFSEALRRISPASTYCKVVLADDWIYPRCLEEMVSVAELHPTAGIVSSYWLKGTQVLGQGFPASSSFLAGRALARLQLQEGRFFFGSPTTVLFRSEIVREHFPFYDAAAPHADTEACYRILREWNFGFVHQILSYLRVDEGSRYGSVHDFFPVLMDRFIAVTKFGADFLSPEEYCDLYQRERSRYFRRLGRALVTRRDPALWAYHRNGLASIGLKLRRRMLLPYAGLALLDLAVHPWESVAAVTTRRRARS